LENQVFGRKSVGGTPPLNPIPEVVGSTVPLTFATRAYELADWYRLRRAKIIFGGLHVLSCLHSGSGKNEGAMSAGNGEHG
jgi:hypothetical protein